VSALDTSYPAWDWLLDEGGDPALVNFVNGDDVRSSRAQDGAEGRGRVRSSGGLGADQGINRKKTGNEK
jgi:hypothetical protein